MLLRITVLASHALRHASPQRSGWELGAEALGLLGYLLVIPAVIALFTSDFFSLRTPQGWAGAVVLAGCLGVYALPHLCFKGPQFKKLRVLWWAIPFLPALQLLTHAVETRHAYLNPFHPEHNRLAAERVLSLSNNIVAGRYPDWVLGYADELFERGQLQAAAFYYREVLRLAPNEPQALRTLALLQGRIPEVIRANAVSSRPVPFWTPDQPVIKSPRLKIGPDLEQVEGCTVMIAAVGEVPDQVLDSIAHAVRHELDLRVYVSPDVVPLPPHTRVRGLATGRQWSQEAIVKAFMGAVPAFPKAPIKYLLITEVDLYDTEANYTFSVSYRQFGALVSIGRFGDPGTSEALLCHRAAKQSLCALIKSFEIPPSPDRNCVTSYTHDLVEFDAKGNRPNAATTAVLQQRVADINRAWHSNKAQTNSIP